MQTQSFGNFQVGMVDDPSIEDRGGFEFASGMDIFSEPGVMKASNALTAVQVRDHSLNVISPPALPTHLVIPMGSTGDAHIAMGSKIYELGGAGTAVEYITNSHGTIDGLGVLGSYTVYASQVGNKLGRVKPGEGATPASQNDDLATLSAVMLGGNRSMTLQGGTLKITAGRYIDSLDESFTLRTQALKLPQYAEASTLNNFLNDLFIGSIVPFGYMDPVFVPDATIYRWPGTILSSGSALPFSNYPIERLGAYALINAEGNLFALVDKNLTILRFDGAIFGAFRHLQTPFLSTLKANNESTCAYPDGFLFSGDTDLAPGIFRAEKGAICQAFVPSGITPGAASNIEVGFVKINGDGKVYFGYKKTVGMTVTYHLERESTSKQNGAFAASVWHRSKTDKIKRWAGVKLNLKPLAASCSVAVAYRTNRNAAFTDSGYTITSSNQDKPVMFGAQPRSREIQFKLTYTTNGSNTPELLSYDPIFEVLNTIR